MQPRPISGDPPRIGLTVYREPARWGVWDEPADLLPASYADSVIAAGAVPLLLPPAPDGMADSVLAGLHGLLLAGGADVDPARYGADRDQHTGAPRADRDGWEAALLRGALAAGLPVLAICRGMQLLNVELGGSLVQHLPDVVGTDEHCPTVGAHGRHRVRLAETGRLAGVLGPERDVATYHHQAVAALGCGLTPVGWAADGTVEAVEYEPADWVVGVQWHPEVVDGADLFAAFAQACSRYRGSRSEALR